MVTLLAGAVGSATVATAQSSEFSVMTITESLDVGGTILAPGTYHIKVVPLQTNRNMLQVKSVDRSELYVTVLSINHPRLEARPATEYVYYPAASGLPKALRTWYPAEVGSGGHDIVYPGDRAAELAARVKEPVPAYRLAGPVTEEQLRTVEVAPIAWTETPAVATSPAPPPPVLVAENKLPSTASSFPLLAGLGFLALGGAASLRLIGRPVA
jgi:hypothetical protein